MTRTSRVLRLSAVLMLLVALVGPTTPTAVLGQSAPVGNEPAHIPHMGNALVVPSQSERGQTAADSGGEQVAEGARQSSALGVSCAPRPAVTVSASRGGPGQVQVSVSGGAPPLQMLRFEAGTNAKVALQGQAAQALPFTVTLPAGTGQTTFTVMQVVPNTAATVTRLVIVDGCGEWPTFVGGGTGALVPCAPRPAVTVSASSGGLGQVQVSVSGGAPPLQMLRFEAGTNAKVALQGQAAQALPFTVTLPAGTGQTTFTVMQVVPNTAATVTRLVIVDACGEWPTFVGGGTGLLPPTGPPPAPVPPAPSTIAPVLDTTVATTVQRATAFLYSGSVPIQTGVAAGTIQLQRAAVIRGKVLTRGGHPLSGATITVLGHSELGQTVSQADGSYDLAANGGGPLTLNFALNGYLPAQRQVQVPWQDYVTVDPVMLVALETTVTAVDLTSSTPIQVARGSVATDADGTRQATVFIPQGTTAMMTLANGTTQPMTSLHVRATEYTVGTNQPQAMPAGLPPTSGYTYAVKLSADEALSAGASQLSFGQPLPFYVENFLQFPTGGVVPVGYYDKASAQWIASTNGVVIKVLSITSGVASLDIDGSGNPANASQLSSLGITTAELGQLGALYAVGQSLWRVPISHFSMYDPNWPVGPPPDAQAPNQDSPCQGFGCPPVDHLSCQVGSIIGCESQSLGEESPIAGTGFTLHYQSDRQAGNTAASTLRIPLSGPTVPASLRRIDVDISAAGQTTSASFNPAPNLSYAYTWNGKDVYGRTVQGRQTVTVRISYVYPALYMTPAEQGAAFARFPSTGARAVSIGCCHPREDIVLAQTWQGGIRVWDDKAGGLGGWSLSVHHAYDPIGKALYLGTGQDRSAEAQLAPVITTVAGNGSSGFSGDGGPATKAELGIAEVNQTGEVEPATDVTVGPDGSLFIADAGNNRIRRVSPSGVISTVAGNGTAGFSGDNGLATQAALNSPRAVALGADGTLFIGDSHNQRIRQVSAGGKITTLAGGGSGCQQQTDTIGDGCPANQAILNFSVNIPVSLAIGADGSLFVGDSGNQRIRRVGPDAIITTVAGCTPHTANCYDFYVDPDPFTGTLLATQAYIGQPTGLAVGADGSLYTGDFEDLNRVLRIWPDGIISTVAGAGGHANQIPGFGDGGPATQAVFYGPGRVAVARDGRVFFVDYTGGAFSDRVRLVLPDGTITTVAGGGPNGVGDGGFATQANIDAVGVAVGPDGSLFIVDAGNNRIRHVVPAFPDLSIGAIGIASEDASEVYVFDADGRHLRTQNAFTGAVLYQFGYDSAGLLSTITDANNNVTTIRHDSSGNPTAIVAPFGQRTSLTVDANGYLSSIADPAGNTAQLSSNAAGLLARMTDARGGVHYSASTPSVG